MPRPAQGLTSPVHLRLCQAIKRHFAHARKLLFNAVVTRRNLTCMTICYVFVLGGLILGLACDHFVVNASNPSMRLGLTELLVGVPYPESPLSVVRHQAPVDAVKHLVFSASLETSAWAVRHGVATAAADGETVEQSALKWLQLTSGRPQGGFAGTKQVRSVWCACCCVH
jgi:enoyl-CoA hydratase/carnithine racemase